MEVGPVKTVVCECGEEVVPGIRPGGEDILVEPQSAGKALVLVHGENESMPAVFSVEQAFKPHRCDESFEG